MDDEIKQKKARFARLIEDGRKTAAFTEMPEYQWYVQHVVQPTIDSETDKIMNGEYKTDKEDWIARGYVMGMRMMIDTPEVFKQSGADAKQQAKAYQKYLDADEA